MNKAQQEICLGTKRNNIMLTSCEANYVTSEKKNTPYENLMNGTQAFTETWVIHPYML